MTTLGFDVFWRDHGASRGMKNLGDDTSKTSGHFTTFQKVAAGAGIAVGAAIFKLGKDSVKAFQESQTSQLRLQDAFARFPKLADVSIGSLQKLNLELHNKTRFDDEAFASGQAVLAQFGLTGKQLTEITPLLADYAAKTGKDLPAAAQTLGKAFLGNTRALKAIGINYKLTGDKAKDMANITQLVRDKVGGFAEKEGKTAAGQVAILKNRFGDIQEEIGSKLLPVLLALAGVALKLIDKFQSLDPATQKMAIGITALGIAAFVAGPRIATMGTALKEAGVSAGGMAKGFGLAGIAILGFSLAAETSLAKAADDTKSLGEKAFQVFGAIAESAGMAGTAIAKESGKSKDAKTSTETLTTASDEYQKLLGSQVTPAVEDLATATGTAYDKQKLLHGEVVDSTESNIAFRDQLADWTRGVRDATKAGQANTHSLSLNNQAGRDNISALIGMAKKANDHASAVFNQTGSLGKANTALKTDRQRLLDAGTAAGFNKDELQKLINKYLKVPTKAQTKIEQPGMALAHSKAEGLKKKMEELERTYNASIKVDLWKAQKGNLYFKPYYAAAEGAIFNAGGNLLSRSEQHVAQVAKPGQWRVWAEDETGGEAYIPLAMSKRSRSVAILKAVAEGFGYQLDTMAAGGVRTTPAELQTWAQRNIQQGADTTAQLIANLLNKHYAAPAGLMGALQFAFSQVGKPYVWGAFGPGGYDCSGFMSALVNVARGQNPYSRVGSTQSFPWGGFGPGGGPFMIGSFRGSPGHMAGTLLGTNVESAGGVGVRVGSSARGARDSMFGGNIWHLASFDRGGMLYPSNRTSQPERVLSPAQTRSFDRLVRVLDRGAVAGVINVTVNTGGVVGMTTMDLENRLVAAINRVAGQGRLDHAVRVAAR
jgi:hypothetical protein